jgi:multimeric flavodoxin WrbA
LFLKYGWEHFFKGETMGKTVLILKGSPRERGNSSVLADQVAAGAKSAGAEVESIYLHGLDIRPCDACDLCEHQGAGCIIDDDMQALYPKLETADAIVLASPVYWFTFSAQMKLCIDRWYAFQSSEWREMQGKQFALVLTYGDNDLYTSGGINAIYTFETMCRFLKSEVVGMVYGTMSHVGDAEKQPELMEQAYQLGQKLGAS